MESVISVKNLSITYDGRKILEKISFDVKESYLIMAVLYMDCHFIF